MLFRIAADIVLLIHLAFIVFVLLGGVLAVRWRWVPIVHLPAVLWACYVELAGRICPLTPLENGFRVRAGEAGYTESFISHYVLPIIYPAGLNRDLQWLLAGVVMLVNLAIYAWLFHRRRKSPGRDG
ncbi:hypothetical protein JHS3_02300 [Jeongeupia sp. HS-3]|uniref:DUF2784 domain-containing protein n=1 Tax=Jeongeupia sp. HS-3 TaxID=1009682 RepID=UPI0018A41C93|nr:DUF2784 domain-containing protein [Jeongeupia sp. HS-3]BCL74494.1 hypothetical protein JHS3_02300 [Jeongeupia sp. HS-3]